jgi:hypothetical protein
MSSFKFPWNINLTWTPTPGATVIYFKKPADDLLAVQYEVGCTTLALSK